MSYLTSLMASTGLAPGAARTAAASSVQAAAAIEEVEVGSEAVAPRPAGEVPAVVAPMEPSVRTTDSSRAQQPRPSEADLPEVLIPTPRPPSRREEARAVAAPEAPNEVTMPPTAADNGVAFLEATAERIERDEMVPSGPGPAAPPALPYEEPVRPQAAAPATHVEAGSPQPAATYTLVREWVSAPAKPRDGGASVEAESIAEIAPRGQRSAGQARSRENEAARVEMMPAEQHVSLSIGAIEVTVEASSVAATVRPQRPQRQRATVPSAIEARRAARRVYGGRAGGW